MEGGGRDARIWRANATAIGEQVLLFRQAAGGHAPKRQADLPAPRPIARLLALAQALMPVTNPKPATLPRIQCDRMAACAGRKVAASSPLIWMLVLSLLFKR